MAVTASGFFVPTILNVFDTTQFGLDLDLENHKGALFSDSITPNFEADTAWNVSPYDANEISGGSWSAGGIALTGTATTNQSGTWTFDATDVSVGTTTLAAAMCYLLYADAASDEAIALIDFVTAVSTTNGTFAITWTAVGSGGVFNIDLTP